mgnify:CR=1 FL=1
MKVMETNNSIHLDSAKRVFAIEAQAVSALSEQIDNDFAAQRIAATIGRVICKIVAAIKKRANFQRRHTLNTQ